MNRCDECKHKDSCVCCIPYGCECFELDLEKHDSKLLDKVADMVLSLPKKYIDNFDYVACALILNGLKKMKAEVEKCQ